MINFLVTFNDVIDEIIEVNGFSIMTDKEVLRFEELASSITWPFTYEFEDGSELYYSNGESFLSTITFKEITNEEAKCFERLFNDNFGFFIGQTFLESKIKEEEGDFDDDDFDDDFNDDYDLDDDINHYNDY